MTHNFIFTGLSIGSRLLTGMLLFILLARLWGPEVFGHFSFVLSVTALLTLIVDFGFSSYLLREIGAVPESAPSIVDAGLRLKRALVPIAIVAAALLTLTLGEATPLSLVVPLMLSALIFSFSELFIAPLRALGRYDIETRLIVSANVAQFGGAGIVAWQGGTPVQVAWTIVLVRTMLLVGAYAGLRRLVPAVRSRVRPRDSIRATLGRIAPYGFDGVLTTMWSQLDVVLVRLLYGNHGAGIYVAGQKLVQGACALAPIIGNVMIPRLSRMAAVGSEELGRTANATTALMWGVGLIFSLPLALFPDLIVRALFGPGYSGLEGYLPFFSLVLFFRFAAAGFGALVTAAGLQRRRVVAQLTGLCCFIAGSLSCYSLELDLRFFLLSYAAAIFVVGLMCLLWWCRFRVGFVFRRFSHD